MQNVERRIQNAERRTLEKTFDWATERLSERAFKIVQNPKSKGRAVRGAQEQESEEKVGWKVERKSERDQGVSSSSFRVFSIAREA